MNNEMLRRSFFAPVLRDGGRLPVPVRDEGVALCAMVKPRMLRLAIALLLAAPIWAAAYPDPVEGDYLIKDFKFTTGEILPELRLHYTTIGSPSGHAVLIMH